jgi:hypothetical protein
MAWHALQSALKLFFLVVVLTTNFGDATKLFIVIYLFSLTKVVGYLPN